MFNPSREDVRRFFRNAWADLQAGRPLQGNALLAAQIASKHPEYHAVLSPAQPGADAEITASSRHTPPFLHLSLHLAVEEQLRIDQPPGIRACYLDLLSRLGEEHAAQHVLLECLGEVLWEAQRRGAIPDSADYLTRLRLRAGGANDKAG